MISAGNICGTGFGESWVRQHCLESTLRFGEFCEYDLFCGDSAQVTDEADLGKDPDDPFRRIDLPGFNSIPVVVLKLVMIVMIPFAESKDRQYP